MAKEFILKAVTPEGLVFEKPVTFAKVRTENGDIGILPNHINLVSLIGAGEMIVREKDKKETVYYLAGGFLEIRQDMVIILGEDMVEASKAEAKRRAKEDAIALAKQHKLLEDADIMGNNKRIRENLTKKSKKIK